MARPFYLLSKGPSVVSVCGAWRVRQPSFPFCHPVSSHTLRGALPQLNGSIFFTYTHSHSLLCWANSRMRLLTHTRRQCCAGGLESRELTHANSRALQQLNCLCTKHAHAKDVYAPGGTTTTPAIHLNEFGEDTPLDTRVDKNS